MSISKILFSFSGRIPRQTYWLATLGIWAAFFVAMFTAGFVAEAAGGGHKASGASVATLVLVLFTYLCVLWCSLAVTVKRWHDRGKSGFWMLIYFVPLIGPLWCFIELGFLEGTPGPNEFEEDVFGRDISLDKDDPLLSTPPIAGRLCAHCQEPIVSFIGAELCSECKEPLHHACCCEHVAGAHRGPVRAAYPA